MLLICTMLYCRSGSLKLDKYNGVDGTQSRYGWNGYRAVGASE